MPVSIVLTPSAIAAADYPIVQKPALGGERDVYATPVASKLLGFLTVNTDVAGTPQAASVEWTHVNLPSAVPGPILAIVDSSGLRSNGGAAVLAYAGLAGTFVRAAWAKTPLDYNFPAGRAVELTGTFSMPNSSGLATLTYAKRGTKIAFVEMPTLTDFTHVGCTNTKKIKLPVRKSKAIACQLNSTRWVKPGATEVAELSVEGLDQAPDDGLNAIRGLNVQAMVVTTMEDQIIRAREFCLDWTPMSDNDHPEGEGESKISLSGLFSRMAVLVAT